ncbi:c-type cytochrome [Tropicimonas sp.]|uniref:c-type cytochrome n=1 Tax=Tropicimonas sp. TaxID=2067044 RepID=UPI003A88F369
MIDTMTMTKTVGALCGALLIYLLGSWAADAIYAPHAEHGEDGVERAYVIALPEEEEAPAAEESTPAAEDTAAPAADEGAEPAAAEQVASAGDQATAPAADAGAAPQMASGDAANGAKVFKKCQACHSTDDGVNKVGPNLHGIIGRTVDSVDGFAYSGALEKVVDVWTPEHLDGYLADPKGFAPGNKMSFAGLKKEQDRADVIAYLQNPGS